METQLEKNKAIIRRFNLEVIEQGNLESFKELMDERFINRTAPQEAIRVPAGMILPVELLRPAFPDMKVTIYEQIAEGDLVTTRKTITGTHNGLFMGMAPTGKKITIHVIDIVRIVNGQYYEHWGLNTLSTVLNQLAAE